MKPEQHLPLSQAQHQVLVALTAGELHGYAIMQAVETSSSGVVQIGPAILYGTLELSSSGDWNGGKLVAYNAVFFVTAIGALACLIAGLRTQRTVRQPAAS